MLRDVCITGLNGGLQAFAQGDLTDEVVPSTPEIENPAKDEVGDVARALNEHAHPDGRGDRRLQRLARPAR